MRIISELYKNVRDVNWYKHQFKYLKGKKNILFVDPVMMNYDFYTMIIPYLALSEDEQNFQTAITGLYRYSEIESKPQTAITGSQVRWSDVIVIPNNLEPMKLLADEIKEENAKCKLIMTIEFDFYEIGNDHYLLDESEIVRILEYRKEELTRKNKDKTRKLLKSYIIKRLDENLKVADRIIVLNENMRDKLQQKGFKDVQFCPIVIDPDTFLENIDYKDTLGVRLTNKMFVLSCELREHNKSAFKEFLPQFEALKEKHKSHFKLVILGEDPKKLFPELKLDYTHLNTGSIVSQFKLVWKSSADIHLLLNKKNQYSSNSTNLFSWVDRGMFGIPIASLNISPLKEIITDGETGFLLNTRNDLIKLVDTHIESKKTLVEMSKHLKEFMIKNCQLTDEKLNWLEDIFTNFKDPEESLQTDQIIESE